MPASDFLIKTGDQAIFNPAFPPALVNVLPGVITGTGRVLIDSVIACVQGDEASVVVPGCVYISPPFVTPGVGTLTIAALNADQIAKRTTFVKKAAILKGTLFTARFTVTVPAIQPSTPPVPDPRPMYTGNGQFVTSNLRSKGL